MKKLIFALITVTTLNVFAAAETANVHLAKGVLPNPILAPMGQLVNAETGEVLYVNAVISVLAPAQLRNDCIYQVRFTRDTKIKSRVMLLPPMKKISCGHDFGTAK